MARRAASHVSRRLAGGPSPADAQRSAPAPAAGGAQAGTAVLHTRAWRPPHGADGAGRLHAAGRALTGSTGARP